MLLYRKRSKIQNIQIMSLEISLLKVSYESHNHQTEYENEGQMNCIHVICHVAIFFFTRHSHEKNNLIQKSEQTKISQLVNDTAAIE